MSSAAYQNLTVTIRDHYRNWRNNYKISESTPDEIFESTSDKKRQILEWLSPLALRERHQSIREGRVDGVGDWLLRTNEFEKWCTGEDLTVHPVFFCYGDPGVGKTYLRYVKVALLKWRAKLSPQTLALLS